jgi:gentisate 1,2-dioxygenase
MDLDAYCTWLSEAGLDAPWSRPGPLIQAKSSHVEPCLWRWVEIEPRLQCSPQFVAPGRGAERRILRLANPGVPERTSAHTLSGAIQYLLPGETAPAHRHTPNALRFMLKGVGAYTIVEGAKCAMAPGDLVLTPSMTWHEHGNEGSEPVMWLDGLDSPVVRYLEILKMEPRVESAAADRSQTHVPRTIHYKWEDAYDRLLQQAESAASPYDDVILEYRDPLTGTSVLPTIGCYLQMIRPGVETRAHRQTSTAVYHVVRGSGTTMIDESRCDWDAGDFFVVPPNLPHSHRQRPSTDARGALSGVEGRGAEPAILFSMQDVPLLEALGLYYESW